MRRGYILGGASLAVITVVAGAFGFHLFNASAVNLPVNDPGAGRLPMHRSACYIAAHEHRGPLCSEPPLAGEGASVSARVRAHLARAVFAIDMQEPKKALGEADAAIALDGGSTQARHLAARLALTLFDIDRAEREAAIARKLAPRDPQIGTTYASILVARQANREAVGVLDDVMRRHPDYLFARKQHAVLFSYLGECCSRGNYQVALKDYDYLIRRAAPDSGLLGQRAAVLIALGKPEPAVADLTAALALSPDNALLLISRAEAYAALEQDALAVKDYDVVLSEAAPGVPLHVIPYDRRAKLLAARALSLVQLKRFSDAANDVVAAISVGGKPAILRAQVLLRRHGFPDVPIDGKNSAELRQALSACFGLKACYQPVMQAI
jgi:tetratricopeptide (TPR) repeat protein